MAMPTQNHEVRIPLFELTDSSDFDFSRRMHHTAERYRAEDALLEAIAAGDEEAARNAYISYGALMSEPEQESRPTTDDELRDLKNSVIVTNTLFRKAIEANGVHPIYIHEVSSYFGAAAERAEHIEDLYGLIAEMVHAYCELVRQCSLASYSPAIQRTILFIDMNIAQPITTRDIAKELFLNPNYLSTRFRRETGSSISDYLLKSRVELASHLLITTQLSMQEVSEKSGFSDASYFSKRFKQLKGCSPAHYRKQHVGKMTAG